MKLTEILNEAIKKAHFNERVYDRLTGPYTTFTDEKPEIKNAVLNNIMLLSNINFLDQDNIGVIIYSSSKPYTYAQNKDGKFEKSEGNFIWVIIRGNDMETVLFAPNGHKPQNTQIQIKIEQLLNYIRDVKNGNTNITSNDLKRIVNPVAVSAPPRETEPVFMINGVKWILTADKELLIKKNNPNDKMSVEDAINVLSDQDAEKLMDLV